MTEGWLALLLLGWILAVVGWLAFWTAQDQVRELMVELRLAHARELGSWLRQLGQERDQ